MWFTARIIGAEGAPFNRGKSDSTVGRDRPATVRTMAHNCQNNGLFEQ
jgi:hypothetical protein